jgi:hypothetical protein
MPPIVILEPDKLRQFGAPEDSHFFLITNPEFEDQIKVVEGGGYRDYKTVFLKEHGEFDDILASLPEPCHILVISPNVFFESPDPAQLGRGRKLMGMACNSTPTSIETIRHFLDVTVRTSPRDQGSFSDTFFELLEEADHLVYVDAKRGTRATLQHLADNLVWNQQAGPIEWGEQQIVPSGEISVLPIEIRDFHEDLRLPLDGEIVVRGYPILHNGTPSFSRVDQARIHSKLAPLNEHAVIAKVETGAITSLRAATPGAEGVVAMLEAMFEVDSRYRIVWEIGHAMNTSLDLMRGNHAMNEVYGGTQGCLHWGLGLTPFTQYHLDIISPDTTVYTDKGTVVLGVEGGYTKDRLAE